MVSGITDINADPGCSKAMDPDMALGYSPGADNTMIPTLAIQTGLALVASQLSGTNMASGGSPVHRPLHCSHP